MSCTGNCNQGRACTCAPEDNGEPLTISEAVVVGVAMLAAMLITFATSVFVWEMWLREVLW